MTGSSKKGQYYLVQRTDLGVYGDSRGYRTKGELETALSDIEPGDVDDYVVLQGVELPITVNYTIEVSE